MIKKIAWNAFKNTGDINAFLELKQIEKLNEDYESNSNWKKKHDELLEELKKAEKQVEGLDAKGQAIYDKHTKK